MTGAVVRAGTAPRTLAGAILVSAVTGCGLSLAIALVAVRLHDAGFGAGAIGLNTAAGGIATLVAAPFIPRAARRIGVARLLFAALVLGAAALLGFAWSTGFATWMALRFALGVAVTAMFVLSEFWITSWAPPGWSGIAIGCYVTSLAIGFALGPLILTVSGTVGAFPFIVGAALFAGAAVPLATNSAAAPPIEVHSGRSLLFFLRQSPTATLAGLLHGCIEAAGLSLLPVVALRAGGSVEQGALWASLFVLGNGALQLPIGVVSDRVDRRLLLGGLGVVGLAGAVTLAVLDLRDALVFDVVLFAWGGIVGAFYPVGLGQLGESYRGADLASANSAFVMTYAAGMLVGPPLVGEGMDLVPKAGFFWTVALLIVAYLLATAVVARRAPSASPSSAS